MKLTWKLTAFVTTKSSCKQIHSTKSLRKKEHYWKPFIIHFIFHKNFVDGSVSILEQIIKLESYLLWKLPTNQLSNYAECKCKQLSASYTNLICEQNILLTFDCKPLSNTQHISRKFVLLLIFVSTLNSSEPDFPYL